LRGKIKPYFNTQTKIKENSMKSTLFTILIIIITSGCNLSHNTEEEPDDMIQIDPPAFSPMAGMYNEDITVELSCSTTDAIIYYTTDGSVPTTASSVYSFPIEISDHGTTMTINALAVKDGMEESESASAVYVINYIQAAAPVIDPSEGVYDSAIEVTINCATDGADIFYTTNGDNPTMSSLIYTGPIPVQENTTIKAFAAKTGMIESTVAIADYIIKCGVPVFSPVSGTYEGPLDVIITSATEGDVIYYTIDGNIPTSESPVYSAPITIPGNHTSLTIMAYAVKEGMAASDISSADYYAYPDGIFVDINNSSSIEDGSFTNPYTLIQDGIDAAGINDTIFVAPGTYMENIILKSNIILQGAGADVTTIDGTGGGNYSVVMTIPEGTYHDITVSGFRITGACYKGIANGGLYALLNLSAITISNNIFDAIGFYGSSHSWEGLAIHLFVIENSTFNNNIIINNPYYSMAIVSGRDITIVNNVITNNYFGLTISNPREGTIYIKNNIITGNQIRGVTLNSANFPPPTLSYNDVWDNGTANYYNCSQGIGGFSLDPEFRDPGNSDFHLSGDSPCINAGDPDPEYNNPDGTRNDMGAYGGPAGEPEE
jgi:hypothetical protein